MNTTPSLQAVKAEIIALGYPEKEAEQILVSLQTKVSLQLVAQLNEKLGTTFDDVVAAQLDTETTTEEPEAKLAEKLDSLYQQEFGKSYQVAFDEMLEAELQSFVQA